MKLNRIFRTALIAYVLTFVPLTYVFYKMTPRPQFVEAAESTLRETPTGDFHGTLPLVHNEQIRLRTIQDVKEHPDTTRQVEIQDAQEHAAARILTFIPLVYSISAAASLAWCIILIAGCLTAHHTLKIAKRKRTFTPQQTVMFNGVIILTITNVGVLILGNGVLRSLMDSIIMWNMGMIVILAYLSIGLNNTELFDCLLYRKLLKERAARVKKAATVQSLPSSSSAPQ